MEISEFKSTHRDLTKFIGALMVVLIVISGYIIQRDIVSLLSEDIVIDEIVRSMEQSQATYMGLTFKYGAMNLFWPLTVSAVFILIHFLLIKQSNIWSGLQSRETGISLDFDALNIYNEILNRRLGLLCIWLLMLLPVFALGLHLASSVFLFLHVNEESTSTPVTDETLLVMLLAQMFTTSFSIIAILKIPGAVVSNLKKFAAR